jgi:hypothetical protein
VFDAVDDNAVALNFKQHAIIADAQSAMVFVGVSLAEGLG